MPFSFENIDLTGLEREPDAGVEPFNPLVPTLKEAVKVNPDQAAQTKNLSREAGVTPMVVKHQRDAVEANLNFNKIDMSGLEKAPATSRFLLNPENAAVAYDDTSVLTSIENYFTDLEVVKGFKRGSLNLQMNEINKSRLQSVMSGQGDNITPEQRQQQDELRAQMPRMEEYALLNPQGILPAMAEMMPLLGEMAKQSVAGVGAAAPVGAVAGSVVPGAGTIAGAVTFGAWGAAGGAMKALFEQEAASAYGEMADVTDEFGQKIDPKIAGFASTGYGIVASMLERLSFGYFGRAAAPVVKQALKGRIRQSLATETGRQTITRIGLTNLRVGGVEGLTEGAQEMSQMVFTEFAKYADAESFTGQELGDVLNNTIFSEEAWARAGQAAKVGFHAGVGFGMGPAILDYASTTRMKQQTNAAEQKRIDSLRTDVAASKLKERDPDGFRELVSEQAPDANVFIDSEAVSALLQTKTAEEIAADKVLTVLQQKMTESRRTEADISIKVADYTTDVVGTDHDDVLRPAMTMSEEGVSPARTALAQEQAQSYTRDLVAEAQANAETHAESRAVVDNVKDQLFDTGRMTAQDAAQAAEITASYFTVQSVRSGKPIEQVYLESGLRIEGPQTGRAAEVASGAELQQLAQDAGYEGADVAGAQEWIQAADKGLDLSKEARLSRAKAMGYDTDQVWWHGTEQSGFTAFDVPTGGKTADTGVYFTNNYQMAASYTSRNREAAVYTTAEILADPGLVDASIEPTFYPADSEGNITAGSPSFGYETEEALQADWVIEGDDKIVTRYNITDSSGNDYGPLTKEEIPDAIESDISRPEEPGIYEVYLKNPDDMLVVDFQGRNWDDPPPTEWALLDEDGETLDYVYSEEEAKEAVKSNDSVDSYDPIQSVFDTDGYVREAIDQGYKRVLFKNISDSGPQGGGGESGDVMVVLDTSEIRSTDAAFDPEQAESDDILRQTVKPEGVFTQTETDAFKVWSEGGKVIESDDINEHKFQQGTPTVLKIFHGTTHEFSVFDALRGNLEGQFGAINYFTSDYGDAQVNYAGEGPDLTQRIELEAEQVEQSFEDMSVDELRQEFEKNNISQGMINAALADDAPNTFFGTIARTITRQNLSGGQDQVMELFVKVNNPFVIGENAEWIEFIDNDAVEAEAMENVAQDEGINLEELAERRDEFDNQIDEARWEVESNTPSKIVEAIQNVSRRNDIDASELLGVIHEDLGPEAKPEDIEKTLRFSNDYAHAEGATGELIGSQLISEVIEEMGFDSIILKDAGDRFSSMDIGGNTAHVHIFDTNKTNIKSVDNQGTFDPTDPDIYKQEGDIVKGYYDPANTLIRLTEASDLSTYLHEFAHFMYDMELKTGGPLVGDVQQWFLRNAVEVAAEASVDQDFVVDQGNIAQFIDVGTAGDNAVDLAIEKAMHEQFARGFETYLMEGKAPSIEMQNVFRTMARWLGQVYAKISNNLNVNLDEEMRQVFDRLIATDEQIDAALARSEFEPMFTEAVMKGMTEAELLAYNMRKEGTKDKAVETLRDEMVKELTRQTEKWWKDEKADIAAAEMENLKNEKVHRAIDSLKRGAFKLDHATVKEMVGVTVTDKNGKTYFRPPRALDGMTIKGGEGVHPDQAAAALGYSSGSEMINDILAAEKMTDIAESRAEEQMKKIHGDMLNDGSIEAEADAAVQNEERGQMILLELKALSRGTNRPVIERKMLKDLASQNIGKLSYRDIHPGKYHKAEIKAAKEAAVALEAGDMAAASEAKARQAMNYYLWVEATQARTKVEKVVDRMGRYRRKNVVEEIKKAGLDYWEQLERVLTRFEFRKSATLKAVVEVNEQLEGIEIWAAKMMDEEGAGLVLTNPVLDGGYQTHWKNVPFDTLMGIDASVRNIEHVARYGNKMDLLQEKMEFKEMVTLWTANIGKQETKYESQATDTVEGRKNGRWAMAQMTKIPYMASWLDNNERVGMSHDILVQHFTDALDAEFRMTEEVVGPVAEASKGRSKSAVKRHNRKIFIPEIKGTAIKDGNLYGSQIVAVALNVGNQSNLKKLLFGEGWANPDLGDAEITMDNPKLQAVLKHMTKEDWDLVQIIWDQMELLYPKLAEVHRKTTGLIPPKIEATPVVTPFGEYKGGYYPVKYDSNLSYRAEDNEAKLDAQTDSLFNVGGSIQASVNASATNERTGYYGPIRLNLDVVPNHFQETIHFITHHDAVRQVNKLIRNPDVKEAIDQVLGKEERAQLMPWLNSIAKDGRETVTKKWWEDVMHHFRFGATLGIMGFKASTGIIQTLGIANTMAEVGFGPTIKALLKTGVGTKDLYQAVRSIFGGEASMSGAWEFAVSNSKVLAHRTQTMDRDIKQNMDQMTKSGGRLLEYIPGTRIPMLGHTGAGFAGAAAEASLKHIALIQTYMVDLPSWHAGYIKGMEKFEGDEARAYKYADWVVEQVQGSGATKDLADVMRTNGQSSGLFTMFMTFFSSLWNMQRDTARGYKGKVYSKSTVAAKVMFMIIIPVYLEMLMRGDLDDEDDESKLQKYLLRTAMYPVQSVPFIRDAATGLFDSYGYNMSPLVSLLENGVRGLKAAGTKAFTDDEMTKSETKALTKFVGASLHLPGVNQIWATGEHLYEVLEEGEDLTLRELLFGPERKQ